GLEMGSVAQISLPGTPADQVIAQSPPPNAQGVASPRLSLLVTAPEQSKSFVMPDFGGMPLGEVSVAITDAGLKVGNVSTLKQDPSAVAQSQATGAMVARQTPAPGQRVSPGMIVNLEVVR
ncbi:MAG TPA: PASTA domain-containing protein, partial [Clostridia bacterium]|nr:PASTA domain-containing protein [Clostridia bacterium]